MVRPLIASLACASLLAVTAAAQRAEMRTVKDVMLVLTIPGSDAVFQAAADPPTTAARWMTLRRAAAPLVESADLMLTPAFAVDAAEWRPLAQAHRAATAAAVAAIDRRDAMALSDASDALYETCEICHKRFMAP